MDKNEEFWRKQYEAYEKQPYRREIRYESWQPGRWAANRSAIQMLSPFFSTISTSCEVGAGSAAFSFELKKQLGIEICGIDLCENAQKYATKISEDMGIAIDYRTEDLFDSNIQADLIFSLGVIEHYDRNMQIQFLKKCRDMSKKYILVSIPNQDSAIFRNYLQWESKRGQEYEEKHQPLTTEILTEMLEDIGMRIVRVDGFQIFLSELKFWNETILYKIPLYEKLKVYLSKQGNKWLNFPYFDFIYEDIPILVDAEISLSNADRLSNGFMTYVLAERR